MISVIVPVHSRASNLQSIKKSIASSFSSVELIIVINNKDLVDTIVPTDSCEKVIVSDRKGRGYAFVKGAQEARGDIMLLLHSDTMLPSKWDETIAKVMGDGRIVGGAFSLSYDMPSLYLKMLVLVSDLFIRLTGEVWGDRAIFVRSEILRQCLTDIDVPLFEDVRLLKYMRKCGGIIMLKEKVVTSADSFRKYGIIGYCWRIVVCRMWYAFGGDPQRIYNYYYS